MIVIRYVYFTVNMPDPVANLSKGQLEMGREWKLVGLSSAEPAGQGVAITTVNNRAHSRRQQLLPFIPVQHGILQSFLA